MELKDATEIDLHEIIDEESKEDIALINKLKDICQFLQKKELALHGFYQIIMFCLDRKYFRISKLFYRKMIEPISFEDDEEGMSPLSIGDHTNAFIHYACEIKCPQSLAYILQEEMYDKDEKMPNAIILSSFPGLSFPSV